MAGPNLSTQRRIVFVGQVEPAFGKQFLDIAIAQGEAEIEPNCVLDDARREAVAAVRERSHAAA
jgi:hypothetical protein